MPGESSGVSSVRSDEEITGEAVKYRLIDLKNLSSALWKGLVCEGGEKYYEM